jgi:hypothetical protein
MGVIVAGRDRLVRPAMIPQKCFPSKDWSLGSVTGQENIAGTGEVISVEDEGVAIAGLIRGFYRIRILPQSSETKAKLTAEVRARSVMAQP